MIARVLSTFLALVLAASIAAAQEDPNYDRWSDVASRAEETLAGERASDLALTALRSELVRFRGVFLEAQDVNANRIATAQEQMAVLGPAPEEGAGEPTEIAIRRQELTDQLAQLRAPGIKAVEAFQRANGLIGEIDTLIRSRQTERLLSRGPVPINPSNWPDAVQQLVDAYHGIANETRAAINNTTEQAASKRDLPSILTLATVGVLLIILSGPASRRIRSVLSGLLGRNSGALSRLIAGGFTVLLPYVGLVGVVEALSLTSFVGFRGAPLVEALPQFGAILFSTLWLSSEIFPKNMRPRTVLNLSSEARSRGRLVSIGLAVAWIGIMLVDKLDRFNDFGAGVHGVLKFPFLVLAALCLVQVGRLLSQHITMQMQAAGDSDVPRLSTTILRFIMRAVLVIGVVGPLIGAAGFMEAGLALVFPAALTLGLLAVLRIVQTAVGDVYVLLTGAQDEARDGLIPVLIGLGLTFGAMPLLAIIWGARWVELAEIWTRLAEGVSLGDTRISVSDFLTFVIVFAMGYVATRAIQATLRTSVLPKTRMEPGARTATVSGVGYVGVFLAALIAITTTGIDLSSLAIVAGALSVGIGFGLQNIVSNFVSGIILLIERPISEGDWIEVGGQMGYVRNISVRSTRIETFDRTDVIVPNTDLVSGTVTNWTRGNTIGRVIVPVGVAYGTDTRRVEKILLEIANDHEMTLRVPAPSVVFQGFGADSLDFEIRAYLRDVNWLLSVKSDLNHAIAARFEKEDIGIPFPQRDVWLRNISDLNGGASPPTGTGEKPEEEGKST